MAGALGEEGAVIPQSSASPLGLEGMEGTSQHDLRACDLVGPVNMGTLHTSFPPGAGPAPL